MSLMWLFPFSGCGWLQPSVDRTALQAAAREHHDAIVAAAPAGDSCDGLQAIVSSKSPEGCGYRPASDLAEAGAVASRCRELLQGSGVDEGAGVVGLHGAWAAVPVPLTTCALLVERRGTTEQRRLLPSDEIAIHGARWETWLVVRDGDEQGLRGWAEVEEACAEPLEAACLRAIEEDGLPATRIAISSVLDALRTARSDR